MALSNTTANSATQAQATRSPFRCAHLPRKSPDSSQPVSIISADKLKIDREMGMLAAMPITPQRASERPMADRSADEKLMVSAAFARGRYRSGRWERPR